MLEVDRFNGGEAQVMISTEAGGEGLNLHHSCHVMVNYDLPWNPSRLVQRIGRLYRYGQTRRVQVINLGVDDGFDAQALNLMLDRVGTMARELAPVGVPNADGMASEILGELLAQIDMEDILSRATEMTIERTRAEVEDALRIAREARASETEILSFAESTEAGPTTGLDHRHLVSLMEGMAPRVGITVRSSDCERGRIDLLLPDDLIGRIPGYGRAANLTFAVPRAGASLPKGADPLDLDTPLMRHLIEEAGTRAFDGMLCGTDDLPWSTVGLARLRAMDEEGSPMTERVVLLGEGGANEWTEIVGEEASDFLLRGLRSFPIEPRAEEENGGITHRLERLLREDCKVGQRHPLFVRLEALAMRSR